MSVLLNLSLSRPTEFEFGFNDEEECSDSELRYYLNISTDEVPVFVMRMRRLGPNGYPPAFTDK